MMSGYSSCDVKRVSFRIRRRYYDMIVRGEKREEIRTDKPYWRKILLGDVVPQIAVFLCGKDVHYRWISHRPYLADPEVVLGRPLSEQGRLDVLTNPAIVVPLGEKAIPQRYANGAVMAWHVESDVAHLNELIEEQRKASGENHYDKKAYLNDLEAEREKDEET